MNLLENADTRKLNRRSNSMLTDTFLRSLKPADKPKKYADGGGLFIYVSTTEANSGAWRTVST